MRCHRCGYAVPEWLWIGDDHPIIIQANPTQIYRIDNLDLNAMKVVAETQISIKMCKEVHQSTESDFVDIGPECFANKDLSVISFKGENYYKACGKIVTGGFDGETSTCVKRQAHKNNCEDWDGNTRE